MPAPEGKYALPGEPIRCSCPPWMSPDSTHRPHPQHSPSRSALRQGQQPLDDRLRLPGVSAPEQVGVIQDVVEVVELTALRPTRRKRCRGLIRAVEAFAGATEQARHRQIRLPVVVVDRRVEEHRLTARAREPVAAPEIPVQERGRRAVPGEEPIHAPEQPLAGGAERSGQATPAGQLERRARPPRPRTWQAPPRRPLSRTWRPPRSPSGNTR